MPFKKLVPHDKGKVWAKSPCTSPEHNPPGGIVLQPGTYTYVCPKCGKESTIVVPPRPSLQINGKYLLK